MGRSKVEITKQRHSLTRRSALAVVTPSLVESYMIQFRDTPLNQLISAFARYVQAAGKSSNLQSKLSPS
jgi:hypothetical protein